MKKIIFILTLLMGFNSYSQECIPPTLHTEIATGDCPSNSQVTIFVGITDFGNGTSARIVIHNSNDTSFEELPIPELNVFYPTKAYPVGTILEISAINDPLQCAEPLTQLTVPSCSELDLDQDGYTADKDCDDSRSSVNPGATEICNNRDDNCDGNIDEGVNYTFYRDVDGDGYGDPNAPVYSCNPVPSGNLVNNNTDCNDAIGSGEEINPGADEICGDGIDNNCDSNIDEGCNCPDADNDGTCDIDDACPNDPNKIAPGDCGCGTPDTDNDGDGTPDCIDNCPSDPNKTEPGTCGCGVAETDTDGDGTPDCNDNCPTDANKTEPGTCGCGVAETDTDGDGIPDCSDECPNDPNNTCNNCPDTDNDTVCDTDDICPGADDLLDSDRDGTPDCIDNCPNDRNKTQPGLCGCGTSDADKDGDGVPDCNDVCPRGPDTDSDGDGVPDCIDICAGQDDKMDSDSDGLPDCVDSCPTDATNTCSGNTCRAGLFEICHVKKNGDATTLCVTPSQWERHKSHQGDVIGACNSSQTSLEKATFNDKLDAEEVRVSVYPNPVNSEGFWIKFSAWETTQYFTATIYNLNGRILTEKVFKVNQDNEHYFLESKFKSLEKGIFILKIQDGYNVLYTRLLK